MRAMATRAQEVQWTDAACPSPPPAAQANVKLANVESQLAQYTRHRTDDNAVRPLPAPSAMLIPMHTHTAALITLLYEFSSVDPRCQKLTHCRAQRSI